MQLSDNIEYHLIKDPVKGTASSSLGRGRVILGWVGVLMILLATPPGWGHDAAMSPVGKLTAIQGHTVIGRPGSTVSLRAQVPDELAYQDVIRTGAQSRSKILFEDDTLLTMGDSSVIEIAGTTYASSVDTRSVTVKLTRGKVRALVGRIVGNQSSELIVLTPTAVASTQGTYFVVWADETVSGVANIGRAGQVLFTSGPRTVALQPGQFTVAIAHMSPETPSALTAAPATIAEMVASTEFADAVIR